MTTTEERRKLRDKIVFEKLTEPDKKAEPAKKTKKPKAKSAVPEATKPKEPPGPED